MIRLLVRLLSVLPLRVVQAIGGFLGWCAWHMKGRSARITVRNLELCYPQLRESERNRLAKRSLVETGKTMAEMGKAWLAPVRVTLGYIKRVKEELDVGDAFSKGKGIITIVPHLGNWEVLNLYAADRFPLNILYQPPKLAELDDFIRDARARIGTKVFPTDRRGVAAMFQALREGEVVGILPDQEPPEKAGVVAPFYGIDAMTMTLISKLAQKTDATVVCAFAKRLPRGKGFEVVLKPADPELYSDQLETSVAALNRSIESCVDEALEQYQWEYKRFKLGRNGKTEYYRF